LDSSSTPEKKTPKVTSKISTNTIALIVCMGIATLLLLLTKLSNKYISDISASVTYVNLPDEKIVAEPLPSRLKLLVESTGFRLLVAKLRGQIVNISIDLDLYKNTDFILSNKLKPQVSNLLTTNYKLLDITPDTLNFHFDVKFSKTIPIIPEHVITFEQQYDYIEPILINPDSVTISGPREIVDPIRAWKTEPLILENLNKSVEMMVNLVSPKLNILQLSPTEVEYVIPIEKYTEQQLEIDITIINVPADAEITIYPNRVKLTFRVGLSNYEKITEEKFRAVADFSGVDPDINQYIDVMINKYPTYIKSLIYSPNSVEYIIYN